MGTTTLITDATLACVAGTSGDGRRKDAALLVRDGAIAWIGATGHCPSVPPGTERIDCGGRLVTPGLIDCHTHLVYAGDRSDEFEQRLQGVSYETIARAGGGIAATVGATRAASEAALFEQSAPRLRQLLAEGVTTVEIKSGYALDGPGERKMLAVADALGEALDVRVCRTFLGAHALPGEYVGRPDAYIDSVCDEQLPQAHAAGLVDAVDVFIESIGFSVGQARRLFECARAHGIAVKAHAEQFSNIGASRLASEFKALSVDHLEHLSAEDVAVLAGGETVAVLLPGAWYFLRESRLPPIAALRAHRVPMAVATDANPGSSPLFSLLTAMNLACVQFRLTPSEALRGVTINAARALGLTDQIGSLEVGKQADLAFWSVEHPAMLSAQLGINPCIGVMRGGRWRQHPDGRHQA
jgi:imidazolonepropionase